jgi:hypothetical protein
MDSFFGLTRKTFTHPQLHEMGEAVALYMSKEVASNPTSNQDEEHKEKTEDDTDIDADGKTLQ